MDRFHVTHFIALIESGNDVKAYVFQIFIMPHLFGYNQQATCRTIFVKGF
jgi:hypothetical protein